MKRTFLAALASALLSFCSGSAFAADPEIVVVRVAGEGLDAAAIRTAVGTELGVTAVAEDDPRSPTASGWIDVEAQRADKKLRVSYQKLGAPVVRSVDLPDDKDQTRRTAVSLAGNVARDEAAEILAQKRRPAPPTIEAPDARERDDDARLRRLLGDLAKQDHDYYRTKGWFQLATGTALLGGGLAFGFLGESRAADATSGLLVGIGGGGVLGGTFVLVSPPSSDHDEIVGVLDRDGRTAALERWRDLAEEGKRGRRAGAILVGVLGGLFVGGGVALVALAPPRETGWSSTSTYGFSAVGVGSLLLSAIPGILFWETPTESAYHAYTRAKGAAFVKNTHLGLQPTAGGAMATAGLTF